MREGEKPLEYFLRMLLDKKLRFTDLLRVYIRYLEHEEKEQRKQIVESAVLLTMHDEPRANAGTLRQLKIRTKAAIKAANIYDYYE